ncbi:DUF4397 domain-containing protein [Burkholderia plantarii]|uniref:DUF4397 domain-containing protein n=1 Tax=Burkholderia plantarii TaxID=41899 RepID=A0A0B6RKE9_BURPL|nr:DUF4397 domain-containing protein [Burkholderia plantarii]AJK45787.1 hypothetical protein BGL_1c12650 [Burkholderia plantarii]ALK30037.1 putative lipoprotein [Burkholderia plantarii]WLE58779.1 DUF4397 domain-containing protein [Burkholderia plantarii]GLZ21689.1 lipoprotein [Burkholderia plantarii]
MKTIRTLAVMVSAVAVLAACGGGDGNDIGTIIGVSKPQARFINAVPLGPNVDYYLNTQLNTANIAYKGVTRYGDVNSGATTTSYNSTGTSTAIGAQSFTTANGHHYTTIALPSTSSPISVIDDPYDKGLLSNQARLRSFNASPNAQNLDIYVVTAGNTNITAANPTLSNVTYQNAVPATTQDSIYLNGGSYQIIVTTTGSKTPVLTTAPFNLANNADWLVLTIPAGGIADVVPNDIHVLIAQGNDADSSAQELGPQ